jgi:hypothetical protein
MPRTLSVSRVQVPAELETEYLAIIRELTILAEARGRHLWLFRSREDARCFLECSESDALDTHRSQVAKGPREAQLERRLRSVGHYEPQGSDLFEEVPLDLPRPMARRA